MGTDRRFDEVSFGFQFYRADPVSTPAIKHYLYEAATQIGIMQ